MELHQVMDLVHCIYIDSLRMLYIHYDHAHSDCAHAVQTTLNEHYSTHEYVSQQQLSKEWVAFISTENDYLHMYVAILSRAINLTNQLPGVYVYCALLW